MTRWMMRIVDIRNKKAAGVLSLFLLRGSKRSLKNNTGLARVPTARELTKTYETQF